MKKLTILIIVLIGIAFSQEYRTLTKDNEVVGRDMVQVEQTISKSEKRIYTLRSINTQIQVLRTQLVNVQAQIDELEIIEMVVQARANAVQLKEIE